MQDAAVTVGRGGMGSMAFFAFLFSASFTFFNTIVSDYAQTTWHKNHSWVRLLIRTVLFVALFLFFMKNKWLHNWLLSVVWPWLSIEQYAPTTSVGGVRILGMSIPTLLFYGFAAMVAFAPILLTLHYWREAKTLGWSWTSKDSRNMYIDGAKTLITASGIAIALLASSSLSAKNSNEIIGFSVRVAAISLITCVCVSFVVILALSRGFERAQSRYIESQRGALQVHTDEGNLNDTELRFILVPSTIALSCFLIGFLFLGRIAFHF